MADYDKDLKDGRWLRARFEILVRDNCRCVDCGQDYEICDVHHTYYTRGKHLWQYPPESLLTLCRTCHGRRHGISVFTDTSTSRHNSQKWEDRKIHARRVRTNRFLASMAATVAAEVAT